jgi:hypothetical protein
MLAEHNVTPAGSERVTLRPYLEGKGPIFHVYMQDQAGRVQVILEDSERFDTIFDCGPYRPGLHAIDDPLRQAQDIVRFGEAYATRGEEFDRAPEDCDQVFKADWILHADAMSGCLPEDD